MSTPTFHTSASRRQWLLKSLGLMWSAAAWAKQPPHLAQSSSATTAVDLTQLQAASPLPAGHKPPMMLAHIAPETLPAPIARYWVSEKLDGVRAWWDGRQLRSRQGGPIHTPAWFTQGWPAVAMDGELWLGRVQFEHTNSLLQTLQPEEVAWRKLHFWVFDLPEQALPFHRRLQQLQALIARTQHPQLEAVPQWRVGSWAQLRQHLNERVAQGAEGLMLHDGHALHSVGRSHALLKLKPLDDAEAVVIRHIEGQGKHAGRLGALEVRNAAGQTFRIGTGFNDAERAKPPPVGSTVTYSYQGLTRHGLPRFTRYVRPRSDAPSGQHP